MLRINVTNNFPDIARRISDMGNQAKRAAAVALTKTSKDAQTAIRSEMARAFDRPTRYTLNSLFVKGATTSNLESRVWLKDEAGKGTPAARYLQPEIDGGSRSQKGMERLLQANGLMPSGWRAVPAAGAQLDGNGNMKRSQIVQILSQLKLQRSAGFESRATGSARSNRTIVRQGVTYFALPKVRRGLQPGIYLKRRFAHGSAIKPVLIFVPAIQYKPRLKFFEIGEETMRRRFPQHFDEQFAKAIAGAGFRSR